MALIKKSPSRRKLESGGKCKRNSSKHLRCGFAKNRGPTEKVPPPGAALADRGLDIQMHFFLIGAAIINKEAGLLGALCMLRALSA